MKMVRVDKNNYIFLALLLVVLSMVCFHGKTGQQVTVVESNTREIAILQASDMSGRHYSDIERGYSCNPFSAQMFYRICGRTSLSHPASLALSALQLHIFSLLKNYQAVVSPKYCFANFTSSRCPSCRYYVFALRKIII
jgi:hypothetical protein